MTVHGGFRIFSKCMVLLWTDHNFIYRNYTVVMESSKHYRVPQRHVSLIFHLQRAKRKRRCLNTADPISLSLSVYVSVYLSIYLR